MAPDDNAPTSQRIDEALAFDDVLLVPAYSQVIPTDTDTRTRLTREIALKAWNPTRRRRSGI